MRNSRYCRKHGDDASYQRLCDGLAIPEKRVGQFIVIMSNMQAALPFLVDKPDHFARYARANDLVLDDTVAEDIKAHVPEEERDLSMYI